MEEQLDSLLDRLTADEEIQLMDNMVYLTRIETESY